MNLGYTDWQIEKMYEFADDLVLQGTANQIKIWNDAFKKRVEELERDTGY